MTQQGDGDATARPAAIEARAEVLPISIEITTLGWLWWAEIALGHEAEARSARTAYKTAAESSQASEYLSRESREAMEGVGACAASLDALYGATKATAGVPPSTVWAWRAKRTAREAQIRETLKHAFAVGGSKSSTWPTEFGWLFNLRDAALHFEEVTSAPVPHPSGLTNVSPVNATYSVDALDRAVRHVLQVLDVCSSSPKPSTKDWVASYRPTVERLIASRA